MHSDGSGSFVVVVSVPAGGSQNGHHRPRSGRIPGLLDPDPVRPRAARPATDDAEVPVPRRGNALMSRALLVAMGMGAVVLSAANLQRDPKAVEVDWRVIRQPAREVIVESPTRGLIVQTITAPGTVVPVTQADVASQVLGRVVAVNVRDGDKVKRGAVLVRIDDNDAKARLESAKAKIERLKSAIAQATADLKKADRDVNHLSRLAERGASSPNELADARSTLAKAEAFLAMTRFELAESEALRRVSQQDLDRTEIRAPIDGVVTGLNVDVGEIAIAGMTNLPGALMMTVSDLSEICVRTNVDEADVPLVRPGQPARVYLQADPATPIAGTIERVLPQGKKSDEVVSFETLVRLSDPGAVLRPGMTATVEVEVRRAEGATGVPVHAVVHRRRKDLPAAAVRSWSARRARATRATARDDESQYVRIVFVAENGVARARPIEVGLSDERRVEILSGLGPSDHIVVGPFRALDELKDGSPVKTSEADKARNEEDP
jgi:HlyD family secretion protein